MAKRQIKNKKPSERWKAYKVAAGKLQRIKRECPKCGPGIFLAEHSDRFYCGRCHYLEMKARK